jgi:hypothetical protein
VARWAHNPEVAGSNPVPATEGEGPDPETDPGLRGVRTRVPEKPMAAPLWGVGLSVFDLSLCGHVDKTLK